MALLYMVCYKTNPDGYQTYWDIHEAERPEDATQLAMKSNRLITAMTHRWTVPYNKAGMTPEQTYADHLAQKKQAA